MKFNGTGPRGHGYKTAQYNFDGSAGSGVVAPAVANQANVTRHVLFALAASGVLMASIDATIVAVALPHLTSAFNTQLVSVGWTITAYQLVQALMMPVAGKLSDMFGRKRVFLGCVGAFTIGSLLCGIAPSIWFLVVARALQGIGGGGLLPSATGIIADLYEESRAQAVGLISSIMPIGGIVGPSLGGFILEHWDWRELFFINLPIGILVAVGVVALFRVQDRKPSSQTRIDGLGLGQYALAMVLLLVALSAAGDDPSLWRSPLLYCAVVASIGLFVLFLRHIKRSPNPLLDYDLVAKPPFVAINLFNVFIGVTALGLSSFIPTYAISRFHMTAFQSGAVLAPRNVAMVGASALASLVLIRLGYRLPLLIGIGCMAITLFLLGLGFTQIQIGSFTFGGFWLLAILLLFNGIGMGVMIPAASNSALDLAPGRAAGITGVRGAFRQSGGVLSVTGIVVGLTFFTDEGLGLAAIFRVLAVILVVVVGPLAFLIPDTARQRRRQRVDVESEIVQGIVDTE